MARGAPATGISMLEFDGVAWEVMQGLNRKLGEKDAEIYKFKRRVAPLPAPVAQPAKSQAE